MRFRMKSSLPKNVFSDWPGIKKKKKNCTAPLLRKPSTPLVICIYVARPSEITTDEMGTYMNFIASGKYRFTPFILYTSLTENI